MRITVRKANEEDLPCILEIQHQAFRREAEEFHDYSIEPLLQTLEDLKEELQTFTYLKAVDEEGQIIGSIRGYVRDRTCYIGKILVHPNYQGVGVGTAMIKEFEKIQIAPRYELYASIRCPQNIRLYERLGFKRFKETRMESNGFVYLEKQMVEEIPVKERKEEPALK